MDRPHTSEPLNPNGTEHRPVGRLPTPAESGVSRSPSARPVQWFGENTAHGPASRRIEGPSDISEQTLTPEPANSVGQGRGKSAVVKKGERKRDAGHKPYEGLFEASLELSKGPMHWEVTDLRTHVKGGDLTWTEHSGCLICNMTIE